MSFTTHYGRATPARGAHEQIPTLPLFATQHKFAMEADLFARFSALLGRFLPRLGPLVNSGGFFFAHAFIAPFDVGARTMGSIVFKTLTRGLRAVSVGKA